MDCSLVFLRRFFLVAVLLVKFVHRTSQDTSGWITIDSGAETDYTDGHGIEWKTDDGFSNGGDSQRVKINGLNVSEQMGTLRYFPDCIKNCYTLPTPNKVKHLIRAGFYYGNYDGLAKPPTFDLIFDSNKWVTVTTSMDEPIFEEMLYAVEYDSTNICLGRTNANETPFISSLEVMPLSQDMYDGMNRNFAWFLSYRVHF
ncbi:putative LRR receptor-like serine/threonine-protein kinase MEE39 [Acorus calamus]|uniref:LRR receptor-like serine/threonine-protein kinase MEE39 n=1 Tax=Acorus calamus TaxID=4465 RepID=A0AAV9CD36_ACOCL|nr:putative LRR receptor-like serine/threonine-protein kinase MEE39 [Acorus calamus]